MVSGWLPLTYVLSFLMAFSIGANDAANGLGISYGTNAISLLYLLSLGALGEFIGAMFFAGAVTNKLSTGIITNLHTYLEEA